MGLEPTQMSIHNPSCMGKYWRILAHNGISFYLPFAEVGNFAQWNIMEPFIYPERRVCKLEDT